MQKFHLCYAFAVITTFFIGGCSHNNQDVVGTQDMTLLPEAISESSALICLQTQFLSINDSGNAPTLYQVDRFGVLQREITTNANNIDWEAMTLHQGQLFIGDIGNNSGARTGIQLYQFAWPFKSNQIRSDKIYQFNYPAHPSDSTLPTQAYQHDRDAEALVSTGSRLLLLSKNWLSDGSQVYELDLANSSMQKVADIDGLPGLITDATYDKAHQLFVVTGYQNLRKNALSFALSGNYQPFLALLDNNFRVLNIKILPGAGQVEGVCVDQHQDIWLSQERSRQLPALLWRFGTLQQLRPLPAPSLR